MVCHICGISYHLSIYDNHEYCSDCIKYIKPIIPKCYNCFTTQDIEKIDGNYICDKCATEFTGIKKCVTCRERHLNSVCIFDDRYDFRESIYNLCSICKRIHLNPENCKYCEDCQDYFPLNYEHCEFCVKCEVPELPH